ncbi:hypothetical protein [Gordonia paraffinivorans]|uniref:hypothetical protein n=1 Tax=Gordonia paraffinivorans TaxID=175628 RepID=UPI00144515C7|nr:hypothetical protein [Gordonia paraffinivorans]
MNVSDFEALSEYCERWTGTAWDGTAEHISDATARLRELIEIVENYLDWYERTNQ